MRPTRWIHDDRPIDNKADELPKLYAELFESPIGKRVLDDIARQAGLPKLDLNSPSADTALIYAARVNLLSYILNKIAAGKRE